MATEGPSRRLLTCIGQGERTGLRPSMHPNARNKLLTDQKDARGGSQKNKGLAEYPRSMPGSFRNAAGYSNGIGMFLHVAVDYVFG